LNFNFFSFIEDKFYIVMLTLLAFKLPKIVYEKMLSSLVITSDW